MKSILISIIMIFGGCSANMTLTQQICNKTSLKVDALGYIWGTNFVYMIADKLSFKLELRSDGRVVINSSQRLEDWSPDIKSPIDMIYTTKKDPDHFYLINCGLKKEYVIRYDDNQYVGTVDSEDCGPMIEYVLEPETGRQYGLYFYAQNSDLLIKYMFMKTEWLVRSLTDEKNQIKAIEVNQPMTNTLQFYRIKDHTITGAFMHEHHWHLFAGRHFCKVALTKFEECDPWPISHWIINCEPGWEEQHSSGGKKKSENIDISIYVVIVVGIISIAIIVITFFTLLSCREYRKKGTFLSEGTNNSQ